MTPTRKVTTFRAEVAGERTDAVAHEEPLEIQLMGTPIAVVMRTPGNDEELAVGFLATERVIRSIDEIASVRHCSQVRTPEAEENVVRVVVREGVEIPFDRLKRSTFAYSSCGVCGKATIEAALACGPSLAEVEARIAPKLLYSLPEALRAEQTSFEATGGLHAAGLFSTTGELLVAREDVGRHNAVDKVIGWALTHQRERHDTLLLVSGRVSFELVQKCAAAEIPLIAGISAPTSLAIEFAEALGVTLIGFLRGETMNVYSHPARVT